MKREIVIFMVKSFSHYSQFGTICENDSFERFLIGIARNLEEAFYKNARV